ncbi:hypothetical protein F2P81_011487 [Scophthalmus maximus]|uniref:Uncharacterized protein n=1 Tax=Scophthalmus maximus TaxID=52904 RepID=A0A6A4SU23_SCOMX|nr:hypothetical protein F2P81_011487 [Scophthalmus maximus]
MQNLTSYWDFLRFDSQSNRSTLSLSMAASSTQPPSRTPGECSRITVEGFAPCGLFHSPVQQRTLFFPPRAARHSLPFPSAAGVEKLDSNSADASSEMFVRGGEESGIFEGIKGQVGSADLSDSPSLTV